MAGNASTLTGPIEGGTRGHPFSAPLPGVADEGYVIEEFIYEGTAAGYDVEPGTEQGIDGRWTIRATRSAPFRTRFLVVRPATPERFNGTVAVNWQNVTAGFEIGTADANTLAEGAAWVGVTAQRIGIEGMPGTERFALKQWDPERYGSLEHPGDDFSFDMYTQIARVVGPHRAHGVHDPMGGLPVVRVLATGGSQSAMRLRTYINAVQPVERVFDGFFNLVDFGWAHPLDTTSVPPIESGVAGIPMTIPARIRDDLDVPVFVFNTETEALTHFAVRQRDSESYRLWELAGACHTGGIAGISEQMQQLAADGVELDFASRGGGASEAPASLDSFANLNVVSYAPAHKAAVRHMQSWLTTHKPPPSQPWLEMDAGPPPTITRDALGNAIGGVRLPELAVPVAAHSGTREGDVLLGLLGRSVPFTPEQLTALYPSRDAFVKDFDAAVDDALAAGVIVHEDAETLKVGAAALSEALPT